MKLTLDKLPNHLKSANNNGAAKRLYWVSGDEPLLRNEACDDIRTFARQAGFDAREKFVIDARFDWTPLLTALQTPSLFAQKKRIELDFTLVKLNKHLTDGLATLLQELENYPQATADNFLLVSSQKLESRHSQSSWYKKVLAFGVHLPIWPIPRYQLPQWISGRLKAAKLYAGMEVATALADQVEGNLLAAQQEIEKLTLLYQNTEITLAHLQQAISDRAQYSTFDFVDAVLAGQADQAIRRLLRLQDTGAEPILILWAVAKETRTLMRAQAVLAQGQALNDWLRAERILPAKQKLMRSASTRLQHQPLHLALAMCQLVDLAIKGRAKLCPWLGLAQLASALALGRFDIITQHLRSETEATAY